MVLDEQVRQPAQGPQTPRTARGFHKGRDEMSLSHLNPSALHTNPAFSQGVRIDGGTLLVIGGQNGATLRSCRSTCRRVGT